MARRIIRWLAGSLPLVAVACASAAGDSVSTDEAAVTAPVAASGRPVLPNWATAEEEAIERGAPPPRTARRSVAPPTGYRVPAEYEPVQAVVMTWAGHPSVLRAVAAASAAAGADVWMVGGPSYLPNVPASRYRALDLDFDSIWSRDYGPVGIHEPTGKLAIVDTTYRHYAARPSDDAMSCALATELGGECFTTSLILDGGNYMTDGRGNAFLTSRIYDWNSALPTATVDALLKSYLGVETLHIFDYAKTPYGSPADGTGHIDMFAKLLGECKVAVVETTSAPFKAVSDSAAAYFKTLSCAPGRTYEVTRLRGWYSAGTWYTYSNSLIVNNTAIIPFYNNSARNAEAVQAYSTALPGYTVVGVNSEETIVQGGSIHCVTREIPKAAPPVP